MSPTGSVLSQTLRMLKITYKDGYKFTLFYPSFCLAIEMRQEDYILKFTLGILTVWHNAAPYISDIWYLKQRSILKEISVFTSHINFVRE